MSNDYVLLVTTPLIAKLKPGPGGIPPVGSYGELNTLDEDVKAALRLFADKNVSNDVANGILQDYEPGDAEGGNGSGGDGAAGGPLKIRWAFQRKTLWNFRVCKSKTELDDVRFPPILRFEACLYFNNLADAAQFLSKASGGVSNKTKLERVFQHVLLVAVTDQA